MMKTYGTQRATDERYLLAEGPVWDHISDRVLWVDIPAGDVHVGELVGDRVMPTAAWHVDDTVGAVAVAADGGLLVAAHQRVIHLDGEGAMTEIARLVPENQERRLNDGKCDPMGRFFVGTLALGGQVNESLFQITATGRVAVVDDDLQMSNGLAWSPDGTTMYSVDTTPGILWQRPYDPESGKWGRREVLLRITDGSPDGICADSGGDLWVAVWGRGEIRQFTPGGEQIGVVQVPAPYVSCVTFAGAALDRLLISTAIDDLTSEQLAAHPDSGCLFLADIDATGLPTVPWQAPTDLT
jgi:sugar lactone lactonase YvrE